MRQDLGLSLANPLESMNSIPLQGEGANRFAGFKDDGGSLRRARFSKGFTLFELVIVIIIVMLMMALFLDRARFYQEQAEKTAMEGIVATVQSALVLQYGQLMTRGRAADVAALARDNPINWLQKKPRNYLGEFYDVSAAKLETGNWAFDLKTRELVYLVRNGENLKMEGRKLIRFHVLQQYEASRLPSLQSASPELTGLSFEPVVPYMWFESL